MLCLLLLGFLPGLVFFVLAIRMQPINGDLTRIGAYPESQYGWSTPQRVFAKPLFGNSVADQADVLVIGDSFATAMSNHQWQNQVVVATGMTVSTVSSYDLTVDQVMADPAYQSRPPRFLVLTLVERHFPSVLARQARCEAGISVRASEAQSPGNPRSVSIPAVVDGVEITRPTGWSDWRDVPLGLAVKKLVREAVYRVSGRQLTKAWQYGLNRADLFSNALPDRLIVFRGDIEKTAQWREPGPEGIDCLLSDLRRKVEADGRTRLVVLVAPDKLTAYTPWVNDRSVEGLSELGALVNRHPDLIPPVDRALHAAIDAGTSDVYLPNNTHWGIQGHMVIGQVMADFLSTNPRR